MPSFTKVVWETLLEPVIEVSHDNFFNSKQQLVSKSVVPAGNDEDEEEREDVRSTKHIYISPALYATPQPTPIPDGASDPSSPSPYIVNHKRRGGKVFSLRSDGSDVGDVKESGNQNEAVNVLEESFDRDFLGQDVIVPERSEAYAIEDHCEQAGTSSCTEVDHCGKQTDNQSYVSYQGEFFDAMEELSTDGSMSSLSFSNVPKLELELLSTRVSLLEEIENRKNAEYDLRRMYNQWERLSIMVSESGLSFPPLTDASNLQFDDNSLEQLHQEIVVARFVSEAIGRGMARAKAEVAAEEIIQSKDHEINRLRDRLQYYEAVNHEMCLRNQENMELARNQRQRKRSQRRWLWWGCVGLCVSLGASAIGYSYLPQERINLSSSDASSTS